jgi:NAD(P)-dependent dehydrogenase (short-subunit alcohol dehydrogenase family)
LASLKQVHELAQRILQAEPRLDVLINNAGLGGGTPFSGRELSQDGYESRFAVNYLAPFLLTHELLPLLKKSAPARIVNVASVGQQAIEFSDIMLNQHFSRVRAYSQSKLALIMLTFDLAEELASTGVTVNALHPATFMNTPMVRESLLPPMHRVKDGAEPTMRLAVAPEMEGVSGKYFDQTRESQADSQAYDMQARAHLKQVSETLVEQALAADKHESKS